MEVYMKPILTASFVVVHVFLVLAQMKTLEKMLQIDPDAGAHADVGSGGAATGAGS